MVIPRLLVVCLLLMLLDQRQRWLRLVGVGCMQLHYRLPPSLTLADTGEALKLSSANTFTAPCYMNSRVVLPQPVWPTTMITPYFSKQYSSFSPLDKFLSGGLNLWLNLAHCVWRLADGPAELEWTNCMMARTGWYYPQLELPCRVCCLGQLFQVSKRSISRPWADKRPPCWPTFPLTTTKNPQWRNEKVHNQSSPLYNALTIRLAVLNKYFPPDFDPSLIPRRKQPKNSQQVVRLMAPFSMFVHTHFLHLYYNTFIL